MWSIIFLLIDCLHLQLYGDSKDRYKQGQTKASLSLQHFLGVESGFTLDKESNTIAIICQDVTVVLAFDTRERLIQWQVKISNNLGEGMLYAKCIIKKEVDFRNPRISTKSFSRDTNQLTVKRSSRKREIILIIHFSAFFPTIIINLYATF